MIKSNYFGDCITVGELIEKLQEFPRDLPVCDSNIMGIETVERKTWYDLNRYYNRPSEDYIYLG